MILFKKQIPLNQSCEIGKDSILIYRAFLCLPLEEGIFYRIFKIQSLKIKGEKYVKGKAFNRSKRLYY